MTTERDGIMADSAKKQRGRPPAFKWDALLELHQEDTMGKWAFIRGVCSVADKPRRTLRDFGSALTAAASLGRHPRVAELAWLFNVDDARMRQMLEKPGDALFSSLVNVRGFDGRKSIFAALGQFNEESRFELALALCQMEPKPKARAAVAWLRTRYAKPRKRAHRSTAGQRAEAQVERILNRYLEEHPGMSPMDLARILRDLADWYEFTAEDVHDDGTLTAATP
jgi:hypothetical protein